MISRGLACPKPVEGSRGSVSLDEGLIWVEFTKTYLQPESAPTDPYVDVGLPENTQKDFNKFFMEASSGQPIRSSIPTAIDQAEQKSEEAVRRVAELEKVVRTISIAGFLGVILGIAGLIVSVIIPVIDLVKSVAEK